MPINQPTVRVLVASSQVEVHTALEGIAPYQSTEAVTTRGVYHALPKVQLAIVELESLIEEEVSRETLVEILNRSRVVWTTPDGFLAEPGRGAPMRLRLLAISKVFHRQPPPSPRTAGASARQPSRWIPPCNSPAARNSRPRLWNSRTVRARSG